MRMKIVAITSAACIVLSTNVHPVEPPPRVQLGTKAAEIILAKITVSNLRKSFDFYTKIVGLKLIGPPGKAAPAVIDEPDPSTEICLNYSGSTADPFVCLIKQR